MSWFDEELKCQLLGLLSVLGLGLFMTVPANASNVLPPLSKIGDPAEAKTMPPLIVPEEHNRPVNLEAVTNLPPTIEFEGSTYTLLKDDELKNALSNTTMPYGSRQGEAFESDGRYRNWGGIAVFQGKYRIANNKVYTGGRTPDQSRAFYKNSAGEFIAINTSNPEGEKKPYHIHLEPRKQ